MRVSGYEADGRGGWVGEGVREEQFGWFESLLVDNMLLCRDVEPDWNTLAICIFGIVGICKQVLLLVFSCSLCIGGFYMLEQGGRGFECLVGINNLRFGEFYGSNST